MNTTSSNAASGNVTTASANAVAQLHAIASSMKDTHDAEMFAKFIKSADDAARSAI